MERIHKYIYNDLDDEDIGKSQASMAESNQAQIIMLQWKLSKQILPHHCHCKQGLATQKQH